MIKLNIFHFVQKKTKQRKLSKYQIENKDKHYKPTEKLILNQNDKKNYVIEGRMLDWYLDHGMILEKIHKKLKYKKSKWLKPYIEFNLTERSECKKIKHGFSDFFYKLHCATLNLYFSI